MYEKQLRIEKTRLSHQVWSHGGSTFKKNMTLNGHFSRPAETDPYVCLYVRTCSDNVEAVCLSRHPGCPICPDGYANHDDHDLMYRVFRLESESTQFDLLLSKDIKIS